MVGDIVRYPQKWGSELTTHITFALEDRIDALVTKDTNKIKVYTGHVLYDLKIGNTCHHISDGTIIRYKGNSYTAESFYETYGNT